MYTEINNLKFLLQLIDLGAKVYAYEWINVYICIEVIIYQKLFINEIKIFIIKYYLLFMIALEKYIIWKNYFIHIVQRKCTCYLAIGRIEYFFNTLFI